MKNGNYLRVRSRNGKLSPHMEFVDGRFRVVREDDPTPEQLQNAFAVARDAADESTEQAQKIKDAFGKAGAIPVEFEVVEPEAPWRHSVSALPFIDKSIVQIYGPDHGCSLELDPDEEDA